MKHIVVIAILIMSSLNLSAQCFEYRSEVLKIENFITASNRNLKKAQKAATLEEAQQFVDKSISQADIALSYINFAKEFAASCDCEEGVQSVTNIHDAIFDFRNLSQKTADCGSLQELKDALKENLIFGDSVLNEIEEASTLCIIEEDSDTHDTVE